MALVITALGLPSDASAQDGVFVDPDSPAGKEYAIPLEQARREAAGGANGREGGGLASQQQGQPLFGVGIQSANEATDDRDWSSAGGAGGDGAGPGAVDRGRSGHSRERQGAGQARGAADLAPDARGSAAIEAAATEGSDVRLTAGIAAAVLGVGLLVGFGLRRLLRDS